MRIFHGLLVSAGFLLLAAIPVLPQSIAGPYLAGRSADIHNDFEDAASYYTQALARDRNNPFLMISAMRAQLSLGRVERAVPIAEAFSATGGVDQTAALTLTADKILREDYAALLETEEDVENLAPLVQGLVEAWALMGQGGVNDALARFDSLAEQPSVRPFALFHKALALASVGDFEGADAIFAQDATGAVLQTRRGVLARVEILSQLGREDEARAMLETVFAGATDPELDFVVSALDATEPMRFTHVNTVQDGFAEVFFSVAAVLQGEARPESTLIYAQVARALRPDHVDALLLTADLFEALEQYEAAINVLKEVPADDPAYHVAELGRADALRRSGRTDAGIEVLEQLSRSHGDLAMVQSALGDALRQQDRFSEAVRAYDQAVVIMENTGNASWFLLYARAISNERQGNWDLAEADFRAALELNPGQPQVLNYLGYSLVEKQTKLDEALEMIEQAVAASPDSGYIIDSLGWALYRLGRFEEAVPHMERAVELMAVDPVVNDHLGDVYWAVGRYREAEFQWSRALSFIDEGQSVEDIDPERVRQKLDVGLDAVLEAEGAPPITVAAE
ncbi:MAG: tetratricopeptide repeat protein [Pseudomonadota bacterium]